MLVHYYIMISLGQEIVAENALDIASKEGHWVVLQVKVVICLGETLIS